MITRTGKRVIFGLVPIILVVGCCEGAGATLISGHRSTHEPNNILPAIVDSPSFSPVPSDVGTSGVYSPSAVPTTQAPQAVITTKAAPIPAPVITTKPAPQPTPQGTPTIVGIRAGEFCKAVDHNRYAYDSNGNLLHCIYYSKAWRWDHA